jgi:multiple sugar transport system permease protein
VSRLYAGSDTAAWTLGCGLEPFRGARHTNRNVTMAATAPVTAPATAVFFFAQKAFVEGVILTGVKR